MFLFNVQHIHRNFDSCQSQHSALCMLSARNLPLPSPPECKTITSESSFSPHDHLLCAGYIWCGLSSPATAWQLTSPFVEVAATCMRRMQFLKYDYSTLYNPCFSLQEALLSSSSMQGVSKEEEGRQITASTQDVDVTVCAKPHWTAPL